MTLNHELFETALNALQTAATGLTVLWVYDNPYQNPDVWDTMRAISKDQTSNVSRNAICFPNGGSVIRVHKSVSLAETRADLVVLQGVTMSFSQFQNLLALYVTIREIN